MAKDGSTFPCELTVAQVDVPEEGRALFAGSIRDATERKRTEAVLKEDAEVVSALARVGRALIAALDTRSLLDRLCQVTAQVLECEVSHTAILKAEEDAFVLVAGVGNTLEEWEWLRLLRFPRSAMGPILARLEREEVSGLAAGEAEGFLSGLLGRRYAGTALLSIALRRGQALVGIQSAGARGWREEFSRKQMRIARGIGQLGSLALEQAHVVEELKRASQVKSEFVATISHELRTPLNAIIGFNSLLREEEFGALTVEQAEALEYVGKAAARLLDLITTTLDLSRLEVGKEPLSLAQVSLAEFVGEVEEESRDFHQKPGVRSRFTVSRDLPVVRTDPAKLKVVLKNLLSNAIKFTDAGTVAVDVRRSEGGIEISVTDTGIGIPPEIQPIIFEAFRQGDGTTTRRYGGFGLGLYIVRRTLELLGGTICVESELGRGSTFRVWLPLAPPRRDAPSEA